MCSVYAHCQNRIVFTYTYQLHALLHESVSSHPACLAIRTQLVRKFCDHEAYTIHVALISQKISEVHNILWSAKQSHCSISAVKTM